MDALRTSYADMSWADLAALRSRYHGDAMMQSLLAPLEHRAYAREFIQGDPLQTALYTLMSPLYQGAKLLHATPTDDMSTPASLDQLFAEFEGLYR